MRSFTRSLRIWSIQAQSLDWTTVRQLDWTPICTKPWSNGRCGALTDRTSTRKCWSVIYGCKALVVHAAEDTLSQARASSSLNQLNAVLAFRLEQSEPLTGPTFYLNRTTERSVTARRRRLIRQSSAISQSRHIGTHADTDAEYPMQSYRCTARCTARCRARCTARCRARCRVLISNDQLNDQTKPESLLPWSTALPPLPLLPLFRPAIRPCCLDWLFRLYCSI